MYYILKYIYTQWYKFKHFANQGLQQKQSIIHFRDMKADIYEA